LFSFNSPHGACPTCNGLGTTEYKGGQECPDCEGDRLRDAALQVKVAADGDEKISLSLPA